jgi:branched-chain amino acid aminotransferase
MQATEKIWFNGELVDWADAKVHVGAHGLHYGSGVFEGIRCYETASGPAVFRLGDHLKRLHNSAELLYMELPYSVDELRAACHDVIGAHGLAECYLRPIAFYGYGELGVRP